MVPLPDGVPPWLIALVPLAVIAAVVTHLVLQSRRGEFGRDAAGRRRVPWVWPVVIAVGAFALLSVATRL